MPIRIKTSRELSAGPKKPPLRETSNDKPRQRPESDNTGVPIGFSPDTSLLRDKLSQAQDQLFARDRQLAETTHKLKEAQLELEQALQRTRDLETEVQTYRRNESYLDQVRAIIRQAKPSVHDLVELALKEERAKVQEKYEQMLDMLAERERSVNASMDGQRKEYTRGGHDDSNNSQIFDLRNYIVKLETTLADKDKIIRDHEAAIYSLKNGIEARDDEMIDVSAKAQLRDVSKRARSEEARSQHLAKEVEELSAKLDQIREMASKATEIVEGSFQGTIFLLSHACNCSASSICSLQGLEFHDFRQYIRDS